LVIVAAVVLSASSLAAQSPADRAELVPFRDSLRKLSPSRIADSVLPRLRADRGNDFARLRLGFALLAAETEPGTATATTEALELFTGVLRSNPEWSEAWFGLGLVRADLSSSDVIAKEGLLQPAGAGFAVGAIHALGRALTLDSSFVDAAVALASHPAFDGWEIDAPQTMAAERLAAVRAARVGDSASANLWLGRAALESEAGSLDSAAVYLTRYLGAGGDAGLGWYRLARVRYRLGDARGSADAYYAGARNSASARATASYRWNVAWVADSAELAVYDSLPAAERADWLRAFWGTRDAEAGRPEGERLREHFRRYEYAVTHFALRPSHQRRGAGRASATVASGDHRPGGVAGGSGTLDAGWDSETVSWLAGASSFFSRFVASQQLLDHRGVIYMRHGPPDRRAISVGAGETWMYASAASKPLIFHFASPAFGTDFDGSSSNTNLAALPGNLDAMCGLDTELCLLGMGRVTTAASKAGQPRIGSAKPALGTRPLRVTEARRQVERAQEWIARGTTTDSYSPRFAEQIEPVVQLYALHGVGGVAAGRMLAVFAIDGDQLLPHQATDSSGRAAYPLVIRVIAFNREGERHELDTVRTFVTTEPLERGEYLVGQLELPLPPGDYTVRMLIEEQDPASEPRDHEPGRHPAVEAERGALVGLDAVRVPTRSSRLGLSDIVLGRPESGLNWWSGRERVPLNPLNAVPRGGTVHLYYEASGLNPGAEYRTQLAVYRRGDEKRRALLTLSFTETANAEWQSIVRTLDMGRLVEGSYDLEVRIQRADGTGGSVDRRVVLNVRGR
jgi:tetratricopeptide (TPR) repeat protein